MDQVHPIKESFKMYENKKGKEKTYEMVEFLLTTYISVINKLGATLLEAGMSQEDIEFSISSIIIEANKNSSRYQEGDEQEKEIMDVTAMFLSNSLTTGIANKFDVDRIFESASHVMQ